MLFDHVPQTEEKLIGHVHEACAALTFLRDVDLSEAVKQGPEQEQWHHHMNALNSARTWLAMAAESLHEELLHHNDEFIAAHHHNDVSLIP